LEGQDASLWINARRYEEQVTGGFCLGSDVEFQRLRRFIRRTPTYLLDKSGNRTQAGIFAHRHLLILRSQHERWSIINRIDRQVER
jgi:hypothetical protein